MPHDPFHTYSRITELSEKVLATSPADETELVWFERRHGTASIPPLEKDFLEQPRLTVLIRVVDGKRMGWHRAESADLNLLKGGIRQALAVSRVQAPVKRRPVMPTDTQSLPEQSLHDPAIAALSTASACSLLKSWCGQDHRGTLRWSETRVSVFNSHGLRRHAATTEVTFDVACGNHLGVGHASTSSRSLATLAPEKALARTWQRSDEGPQAVLPSGPIPALLAPEAMIEMLNALNMFALSGRAYLDGSSFLTHHRGEQVFHRSFNLRDDGTDQSGLSFPFDLEGSPKISLDLIVDGCPSTPALDRNQGAEAGLVSTAQAVGGGDSLFGNLFMLPGKASEQELLSAAEGGIHIAHLDPAECFDPAHLRVRTLARGVRCVENGRLGVRLPDLIWEESLLSAFARVRAIGNQLVVRTTSSTPMGAICAPAIVLMESEAFTPHS
jgi:predicted Zn-dependent protease